MKKLIVLLFLLPVLVMGQDFPKEIVFVKNLDLSKWNKIVGRATKEDKIIFIQYGFLENNNESLRRLKATYNDTRVLNYLNSHFICFFIPFKEFKEAHIDFLSHNSFLDSLMPVPAKGQGVPLYFFTKDGKHLHKRTRLPMNSENFIKDLQNVVNGKNNYYQVIAEYNDGNRSIDFFRTLYKLIVEENENFDNYLKEFIRTRENLFTKENAAFLLYPYYNDIAFDYLYNNQETWISIVNKYVLDSFYASQIVGQVLKTYHYTYKQKISADDLIQQFEAKYPRFGKEASVKYLFNYWLKYDYKNPELGYLVKTYVNSNSISELTTSELNSYAWAFFERYDDSIILTQALSWSKKSLEQDKDNPMYLDTYANILYKLGQTNEAIEIETKALELIDVKKKKEYQETLDKMKKGVPTWK